MTLSNSSLKMADTKVLVYRTGVLSLFSGVFSAEEHAFARESDRNPYTCAWYGVEKPMLVFNGWYWPDITDS